MTAGRQLFHGRPHASYEQWIASNDFRLSVSEHRAIGDAKADLFRLAQDEAFPDPALPYFTVQMLTAGALPIRADFGAGRFSGYGRADHFVLGPDDVPLDIRGEGRFELLTLALPGAWVRERLAEDEAPLSDFGRLHGALTHSPRISSLLKWIWDDVECGSPGGRLAADAALTYVVANLHSLASTRPAPASGGLAPWQVRRATEYLMANLDRDVALSELASVARLSPHHFCRAFKASLGVSPSRWLVERRIDKAKELMLEPAKPLVEVAFEVGYESQGAFGTAFRRVTGTTPAAWRRDRLR